MRRIAVIHAGPMTSAPPDPRPVGVVLAAGAGTRLRPLTDLRPKALCPVANRPLVDWALDRVAAARQPHRGQRSPPPRAAAGAPVRPGGARLGRGAGGPRHGGRARAAPRLGRRRGRAAHQRRLVVAGRTGPAGAPAGRLGRRAAAPALPPRPGHADFGDLRYVGSALLPWWSIRDLPPTPAGLYEVSWAGPARGGPGRPGRGRTGAYRLRHARRLPRRPIWRPPAASRWSGRAPSSRAPCSDR